MSLKTYNSKQVTLVVGGVPLSGLADGTFVKIERSEDAFKKVSGADGVVSRSQSNDKSGSVTFTLAQTSMSNDVLTALAIVDEQIGMGVVPVIVKDINGLSLFFSKAAWVRKIPSADYSKEITNREWILDCVDLAMVVGGNIDQLTV